MVTLDEITIYGEAPKPFNSPDAAAIAALRAILPTSLARGVEFSGPITKAKGKFYALDPDEGDATSSPWDFSYLNDAATTVIGIYHTHPVVGSNWENFSGEDFGICATANLIVYLGTKYRIKKLIPKSLLPKSEQSQIFLPAKQVTLLSHDIQPAGGNE